MIRRSPCELYIKFLLCHPDGYDVNAARAVVYKQQLDWVDDTYAEGLRDRMEVPVPFFPNNPAHKASMRFLFKEKLYGFFLPDDVSMEAHKLLNNAKAKEVIETMTLAEDPPAFIAHRLKTMKILCSAAAIQRYCSFYWDLSLVDRLEITALIRMRVDRTLKYNGEQYGALKSARYKDPRMMMLDFAVSPVASFMNQIRHGVLPTKLDLSKLAHAARSASMGRILEAAVIGGKQGGTQVRDYSTGVSLLSNLINDLGSPEEELKKGLQQLAIRSQDANLPLLSNLSGGQHTTDLQPVEEGAVEEMEDEPGT